MAQILIKKCQNVTKTIIKKVGQCTHMNSNYVHNCVKHILNTVHGCMIPFRNIMGLVHHSKKDWGVWHINTC